MITFSKLGQYGRLGNQLWQIASTIGIAVKNRIDYDLPPWYYQIYFKNYVSKFPSVSGIHYDRLYKEIDPYYHDVILSNEYNWDLEGYFQSYKYFEHCKKDIEHYLYFPKLPLKGVAVHVRRGDYLNHQDVHPVLSLEYYKEAMKLFKGEHFTIFSDDIVWCKENIVGRNISYFEPNGSDWLDFSYMAGFSKFIIANSSFSWWAAWLKDGAEVVAPKLWVHGETRNDRVPNYWIRI